MTRPLLTVAELDGELRRRREGRLDVDYLTAPEARELGDLLDALLAAGIECGTWAGSPMERRAITLSRRAERRKLLDLPASYPVEGGWWSPGYDVCVAVPGLHGDQGGADESGCRCIEWVLDSATLDASDLWRVHQHRQRVREQRRALREGSAQTIAPKLPSAKWPEPEPEAPSEPEPRERTVGPLRVIDGGRSTASGADLWLPEVVSSTTNGGRRP
jgi:hypothetical protein